MCLIMLYMCVLGRLVLRCSSRLLCEDRVGQGYIQRVVVLDQRGVFVVQDQVFQGTVKVVGLSKSKTGGCLENYTMFDLSIHAVGKEEQVLSVREILRKRRPQLEKRTLKNLTIPLRVPLDTSGSLMAPVMSLSVLLRNQYLEKKELIFKI